MSVQIDMTSSFDNFLILYSGSTPSSGGYLQENDDTNGTNARITRTLSSGTYCIEVTSYSPSATGSYTLTSNVPLGDFSNPDFMWIPIGSGSDKAPASGTDRDHNTALVWDVVKEIVGSGTATYSAGGGVTTSGGSGISGVTMTFTRVSGSGAIPGSVQTVANGNWSQSGFAADGTMYRATPSKTSYTFSPTYRDFNGASTSLNFTGSSIFSGSLSTSDGQSVRRSGRYADVWTFTVSGSVSLQIDMTSSFDNFLILYSGSTPSLAGFIVENDDTNGTNARITRTLSSGTYCIEATSYSSGATGIYTLTSNVALSSGPTMYGVSGRVTMLSGTGISGVTMTFTRVSGSGAIPGSVQTDSNGNWSKSGFVSGTTYRATPSKTSYTFSPTYLDFSSVRTDLNFTGSSIFSGSLSTSDGQSVRRSGRYADVWTFTVSGSLSLQIDMTSSFDNFLILYSGSTPLSSGFIVENDDTNGTNARITRTLSSGTYCIEATSYGSGATGSYTLSSNVALTQGPSTHSAGGRVTTSSGSSISGVTITFTRVSGSGAIPGSVQTDSSGNWSQSGFVSGTTYRATPSKSSYTFNPTYRDFSSASTLLNFTGSGGVYSYSGSLSTSDGQSVRRSGRYADVWRFTVSGSLSLQIDMTSSFDNFLILYSGSTPSSSGFLVENDDTNGANARITRTLSSGTYCIEATSYSSGATGSYTLTSNVSLSQ
jgi:hypothetical protein